MVVPTTSVIKLDESVNIGFILSGTGDAKPFCLVLVSTPGMVNANIGVEQRRNGASGEEEAESVMGQTSWSKTRVFSFGLLVGDYVGADLRVWIG